MFRRLRFHLILTVVISVSLVLLVSCGGAEQPTEAPTSAPAPQATQAPAPGGQAQPQATEAPGSD